jgi:hypothetical protein
MVPKRGLEPPHPCEYVDLNHARLPIPPLRHICSVLPATSGSPRHLSSLPKRTGYVNWIDFCIQWVVCLSLPLEAFDQMKEIEAGAIPGAHAAEIRRLVHDLSNALEIIVQTNYLLRLGKPDETSVQWLNMMDTGVRQATEISSSLRKYVVDHAVGK